MAVAILNPNPAEQRQFLRGKVASMEAREFRQIMDETDREVNMRSLLNLHPSEEEESLVTIKIYNILGQEIVTLVDEHQGTGSHFVEWNGKSAHGSPVGSGVYFYRVEVRQAGGQSVLPIVKKMVLMK